MPVVTHHEVIILLEGVFLRSFPIDEDLAILDLQGVVLVVADDPFVEREGFRRQLHRAKPGAILRLTRAKLGQIDHVGKEFFVVEKE